MSKRLENEGAEKWMLETVPVLDKGYVKLVSYDGTDKTIVQAARVSYGRQDVVKTEEEDNKLIAYLMKHQHSSPFEQCSLTFEIKAPIFVLRQWMRYRTAKVNEMSLRYVEAPDECYEPSTDRICVQSPSNKQASGVPIDKLVAAGVSSDLIISAENSFNLYHKHINEFKVAREIARIGLPMSTYSIIRWQIDLRNLLNFMEQRAGSGAQEEIRQYTRVIGNIVKDSFPVVFNTWIEYVYKSIKFSNTEMKVLLDAMEEAHSVYPLPNEVFALIMRLRAKVASTNLFEFESDQPPT